MAIWHARQPAIARRGECGCAPLTLPRARVVQTVLQVQIRAFAVSVPSRLVGMAAHALSAQRGALPLRSSRCITPSVLRRAAVAVAAPLAPGAAAWSPESWRTKKALQMPDYRDPEALKAATAELRRCPPLIFAGEVRARCSTATRRVARAGRRSGPLRGLRRHFLQL